MKNAINWFEIPVSDMPRACQFYGAILNTPLNASPMCGGEVAVLPYADGAVGGSLFKHTDLTPTPKGTVVYLNGGDDLSAILDRVGAAGGSVALPKTAITPEIGYMALFIDSEGNRVGLHSPN
ncbi:VOC family protein [Denitromonas ohlonensis]|uniref:VOC family protein n=2 Tax=Denitromonas TaxID=139331 RepID=A0A557SDU8_9RHOO|nr:VOC family protein [Denitromonas ohlonensis]TVO64932.1 VOC family protein [Denitromonas ohlonensis]TVO75605.1 VOC family protein [Denitromonas ohlonensis]